MRDAATITLATSGLFFVAGNRFYAGFHHNLQLNDSALSIIVCSESSRIKLLLSNFLSNFLNRRLNIVQYLLQNDCLLCSASCTGDLCRACHDSLPQLPANHCPLCLLPAINSRICGACLASPPTWTHAIAALQYAFPIDAMIRSLKYQQNLTLVPMLSRLLTAKLSNVPSPEVIIPVPLHPARLQHRGFNQVVEIGRYVSRQLRIPLLPHVCERTRDTLSQTELSWKERRSNLRNAFACTSPFAHKHVAILDDVMTSGATLNELAKVIRKQGANEISVWVIARAMPSFTSKRY